MSSVREALEPCPFCGGTNILQYGTREGDELVHYEQCADCTACGPDHKNGLHWNRRVSHRAAATPSAGSSKSSAVDIESAACPACGTRWLPKDGHLCTQGGNSTFPSAAQAQGGEPTPERIFDFLRTMGHPIPEVAQEPPAPPSEIAQLWAVVRAADAMSNSGHWTSDEYDTLRAALPKDSHA